MSKKVVLVLLTLVLFSLIFGGYLVIKSMNSKSGDYDYKIKKGEQFTINLDENITTGYSWHLKKDDKTIVKLFKDEYQEPSSNLIGASGTHKFIFVGEKKGDATITFKYYRSWEGEDSSVEVKEFKVKVY
ncbi:MAG: protease inhibitor I42 family protein [Caldisericia bacterium]